MSSFKFIKKNNLFKDPKRHLPEWRRQMRANGEDVQDEYVPSDTAAPKKSAYAEKHEESENAKPQSEKKRTQSKPKSQKQQLNDWQKKKAEEKKDNMAQALANSF